MATTIHAMLSKGGILSSLSHVMTSVTLGLGGALPIGFLLMSSILPVFKVLLIAGTGLAFAQPRVGVLNAGARHSLSKLVFTIFLPAIIFVNLGEAITVDKLLAWWFIPLNVIIASCGGCLIGTLVAKLTNAPPEFFRLVLVLTGIGNMGNMPLVLISAVCSDVRNPFGDQKMCNKTGTAYVSLGMWMAAIIMWGIVYNVLAPPQDWLPEYDQLLRDRRFAAQNGAVTKQLLPTIADGPSDAETPASGGGSKGLTLPHHEPVHLDQPHSASHSSSSHPHPHAHSHSQSHSHSHSHLPREGPSSDSFQNLPLLRHASSSLRRASEAFLVVETKYEYWMKKLHIYDVLRPPVLAAFLAMLMGTVPFLEWFMFDANGPLRFLTDAIAILGQAMIPCILLVLGGNLVGGPGSSELPFSTTVGIVIARLVVVPMIGIGVVLTADRLGFLPPDDKMFRFVLFLQHTMPSSIQIGTACSLRGFGEKEVSAILFFQHLACVVTMTFYLFAFFFILFG